MDRMDLLKDFLIFQIGPFSVFGLYSKKADTKIKRILHYLPVVVIINRGRRSKGELD